VIKAQLTAKEKSAWKNYIVEFRSLQHHHWLAINVKRYYQGSYKHVSHQSTNSFLSFEQPSHLENSYWFSKPQCSLSPKLQQTVILAANCVKNKQRSIPQTFRMQR
jgi:hypothetical protein